MNSKAPKVTQRNWLSMIPQLIIMGIIILIWHKISPENVFLFSALTYLLISLSLRNLIPHDHRKGIKNSNIGKFENAISDFEKSYAFFKKHKWIDNYRFIILLSSSKMAYKEMALANIAFCYSQIGNGIKSKAYYERTLKEYPENRIAKSALKMMNAVETDIPQQSTKIQRE
ncbi:tetratricopeptide repeat protein [Winogradskyella sp. PC D3.3]